MFLLTLPDGSQFRGPRLDVMIDMACYYIDHTAGYGIYSVDVSSDDKYVWVADVTNGGARSRYTVEEVHE